MTDQERMEKLARDILGFYFCNKDMEAIWMPEVRGRFVDALLTVFQEGYQAALAQLSDYKAFHEEEMKTQTKPRLPLSEADRQMLTYLSDANSSARVAIALDSSLRAALAEVKKLRNELATTSKGSMTVEKMQEQLAPVIAERDDYREQLRAHMRMAESGVYVKEKEFVAQVSERDSLKSQLLASAAENVRLRDALKGADAGFDRIESADWNADQMWAGAKSDGYRVRKALSSTPTALVGAIEELRDRAKELVSKHPDDCEHITLIWAALAAYDDALGRSK